MKRKSVDSLILLILAISITLLARMITRVNAQGEATIWTDKPDYMPEEIVTIFGTGFMANSNITIEVTRPDMTVNVSEAISDEYGNFTTTYDLDGITGTYAVIAADGINTATTTFTDNAPNFSFAIALPKKATTLQTRTYTVNMTAENPIRHSIGSVRISFESPSTWGTPTSMTLTPPASKSWSVGAGGDAPSAGILKVYANTAADELDAANQVLTISFSIQAPSTAANYRATATAYDGRDWTGDNGDKTDNIRVEDPPSLSYVAGSLAPTSVAQGQTAVVFSVEVSNGGGVRAGVMLNTSSTFSFTDGTNTYTAYLAGDTAVGQGGGSATLTFVAADVPSSMAAGSYTPSLYLVAVGGVDFNGASFGPVTLTTSPNIVTVTVSGVTMTVSYLVVGGGSPTAPTFNYIQGGISKTYTLTNTATPIQVDLGSSWSVTPDPLTGSTLTERWHSSQVLSGTASTGTFVFTYYHQFKVSFHQTGLDSDATGTVVAVGATNYVYSSFPVDDIWIDSGTSFTWTATVSGGSGKRFVKTGESGLASPITTSGTSTATYKTQYYLTFTQTGLDGTATGTVVTVDGTTKTKSHLPLTDWFDVGTTYSYTDPVSSSVSGKRFSLTDVTGTFGPDATISGNYHTEYHVTFTYSGLDADATSTVVTIGGNAKVRTDLPLTDWFDSTTSFTYESIVDSSVSGKRFSLTDVTGTFGPDATISGNYHTEYYVTFAQTGLGDATGTVVTIGGSAKVKGDLPLTDWFDSGTTYSYEDMVSSLTADKRFRLIEVTGQVSPISTSGTITGNYKTQWFLTNTLIANSVQSITASQTSDSWYDDGTDVYVVLEYVWDATASQRSNLFSYTVDGSTTNVPRAGSGTFAVPKITMNTFHSVSDASVIQYYLKVSTNPTVLTPQPTVSKTSGYTTGDGYWDTGSVASIDPDSPAGYTFDHWNGDASGSTVPLSVTMSFAKDIVAVFRFNLAVETGFKPGDSPSFASDPYLDEIMCVLQKTTTTSYKLVGTSPGTYDYAIAIKNTGTTIFSSITITVTGNGDHYFKSSNPIRVLSMSGNDITSQFTISMTWPTVTITSNSFFQGLRGSASLYVTIHLDYTKKGLPVSCTQLYSKAYTFKTTVSGTSGPNSGMNDGYSSVVFLSKKMTVIYGFVKTSSGAPIKDATIDLYKGSTLLYTVHTDEDGFYCFIDTVEDDNGKTVTLSGGTIYTLMCTLSDTTVLPTRLVTAQTNIAVQVLFTKP